MRTAIRTPRRRRGRTRRARLMSETRNSVLRNVLAGINPRTRDLYRICDELREASARLRASGPLRVSSDDAALPCAEQLVGAGTTVSDAIAQTRTDLLTSWRAHNTDGRGTDRHDVLVRQDAGKATATSRPRPAARHLPRTLRVSVAGASACGEGSVVGANNSFTSALSAHLNHSFAASSTMPFAAPS